MQKLRWYAHYACQRRSKKIQWKKTIWKLNSKFSRILRRRRISHREFQFISGFWFLNHSVLSTVTLEAFSLATVTQCCSYIFWLVNNLKKPQPIQLCKLLVFTAIIHKYKTLCTLMSGFSQLYVKNRHFHKWNSAILCIVNLFAFQSRNIIFPRGHSDIFNFPLRKIPSPIDYVWNLLLKIVVQVVQATLKSYLSLKQAKWKPVFK